MNLGTSIICLTRIADNVAVVFPHDFDVHDDSKEDWSDWQHTLRFMWEEGNYSCSCNRFLFFERALGTSEAEIDAMDELHGGCNGYRYRVNWIKNPEGEVIYREDESQNDN